MPIERSKEYTKPPTLPNPDEQFALLLDRAYIRFRDGPTAYEELSELMKLIAGGANVNARGATSGATALMVAAIEGDVEAIRDLLAVPGIEVNAKNVRGDTALIVALRTRVGDRGANVLIDDPRVDVNIADAKGITPLMWAIKKGDVATVKQLLARGADVTLKDGAGNTALSYAYNRLAPDRMMPDDALETFGWQGTDPIVAAIIEAKSRQQQSAPKSEQPDHASVADTGGLPSPARLAQPRAARKGAAPAL